MRRIKVIHVLLERGANVGAEDKHGRTPFFLAKEYGYDEIINLLSEHGAEYDCRVMSPFMCLAYIYLCDEMSSLFLVYLRFLQNNA